MGPAQAVSPENSPNSVLQPPDSAPHSPYSAPLGPAHECTTLQRTYIRGRGLSSGDSGWPPQPAAVWWAIELVTDASRWTLRAV